MACTMQVAAWHRGKYSNLNFPRRRRGGTKARASETATELEGAREGGRPDERTGEATTE